ncbi:Serine/arginine-rich splicing factor SC35 [Dichanthelium oligosanthes]|uniref:Serine/arginine-rich splicing factor SC35 n=1 Tax=Dichanthelium oligosanthes TaxID=888268 RepID=A0A1E5W2Z0_9POAL|nr:Serine/arginine-rich splicing factor SC35 [Dichanthelium oligosanthes]
MSHFGRSGPPDIRDTFSLLVLNISFRTTADDLFPLFERYGKVVDVFIPRDRRTGDSRGFAFVRYKYADEAQKAVDRLDGRNVDGRNIMVQFAKYGPNAEPIRKGRVIEHIEKSRDRSRSRSPRPREVYFLNIAMWHIHSTERATETETIGGEVAAGAEKGMTVIKTGTIVVRAEAEVEAEAEAEARVQVLTTKVVVEQEMMVSARAGARAGAGAGAGAEAGAGVEATHTIGVKLVYLVMTENDHPMGLQRVD